MRTFPDTRENSLKNSESGTVAESAKEVAFVLTNDAHMVLIDSISGKTISSQSIHTKEESTAICMYLLGKYLSLMIQTYFCAQMFTVFVDLFASRRRRSSPWRVQKAHTDNFAQSGSWKSTCANKWSESKWFIRSWKSQATYIFRELTHGISNFTLLWGCFVFLLFKVHNSGALLCYPFQF